MKTIAITLPDESVADETERIVGLLRSGYIDRVHIRKPDLPADSIRSIIDAIPADLHSRLSIHSHPELLTEYPAVGWHFSDTRPVTKCSGPLSRSCHTPYDAMLWTPICDYVTLSPVFDSISKHGYHAAIFDAKEEREAVASGIVIALGGVSPSRLPELRERGYAGAAMLGYVWNTDINQLIDELKCYNS